MRSLWPDNLQGYDVELKRLHPCAENARLLASVIRENERHLNDSLSFFVFETNDEVKAMDYLTRQNRAWEQGERNDYYLFYENRLVGGITLLGDIQDDREVIYWLDKGAEGHGLMGQALHLVEQEQAAHAPRKWLYATVKDCAKRSQALLEKNGYHVGRQFYWKIPVPDPVKIAHHNTLTGLKKEAAHDR